MIVLNNIKKIVSIKLILLLASCGSVYEEKDTDTNENLVNSFHSFICNDYKKIPSFSSGSGMDFYNGFFYLVGDDDPFLVKVNTSGKINQKWEIWDSSAAKSGRIPKKIKPDFEAISVFPCKNDTLLLIFGSGSKSPNRDVILSFNTKNEEVYPLNGEQFFAWLKTTAQLSNSEINLEGATFIENTLYLFNRHNNEVYAIPQQQMERFISDQNTEELTLERYHFELPVFQGDTARFSSAASINGAHTILFSASIETTNDWEEDGAILGSFIGKIDLKNLQDKIPFCVPVFQNDSTRFEGKIEGVHGFVGKKNELTIYFITDDDDGTTGWGRISME